MPQDLISFDDDVILSPASINGSPIATMASNAHLSPVHRDSFSELTTLMRAKKPYAATPSPTSMKPPPPSLALLAPAPNGE